MIYLERASEVLHDETLEQNQEEESLVILVVIYFVVNNGVIGAQEA